MLWILWICVSLCKFARVGLSSLPACTCGDLEVYFSSCLRNRTDVLNVFLCACLCNSLLSTLALNLLHCDVKSSRVFCDGISESDVISLSMWSAIFNIALFILCLFELEVHFWAHKIHETADVNGRPLKSFDSCVLILKVSAWPLHPLWIAAAK